MSLWGRLKRALDFPPCAACGVKGGIRWLQEREEDGRIIEELVCDECRSRFFFGHYGRQWERLLFAEEAKP
jgi:hypothetical protein